MRVESILILNGIEKQIAYDFIETLAAGELPPRGRNTTAARGLSEISYEYRIDKQDKIVSGIMADCAYKLRYRDRQRIFFSSWDVKDVCSIFYGMVMWANIMSERIVNMDDYYLPFEVDLNTETYVFFTGEAAKWIARFGEKMRNKEPWAIHESQYVLRIFDSPRSDVYDDLIERLKAEYDEVYVIQVWIRGEVLYFALADGAMLRSEKQRFFTAKEEADLARKLEKFVNDRHDPVDLSKTTH
jgi:hypothetical protein